MHDKQIDLGDVGEQRAECIDLLDIGSRQRAWVKTQLSQLHVGSSYHQALLVVVAVRHGP